LGANVFIREYAPLAEAKDAICTLRDLGVVRDQDKGPALVDDAPEDIQDFGAARGVEVSCCLVGKDQSRIIDKGSRDGDALLFAAGQFARKMLPTM
jgi:hypothetical protein